MRLTTTSVQTRVGRRATIQEKRGDIPLPATMVKTRNAGPAKVAIRMTENQKGFIPSMIAPTWEMRCSLQAEPAAHPVEERLLGIGDGVYVNDAAVGVVIHPNGPRVPLPDMGERAAFIE